MRPKRCPSVRATFGSRSGPITISATTAITRSSEKPMSNMGPERRKTSGERRHSTGFAMLWRLSPLVPRLSPLGLHLGRFLLGLAVYGVACRGRDLSLRLRGIVFLGLHAVLESFHRAAQVLPQVAQFLGAEDEHHYQKHDQPVPDAKRAHVDPPVAW